MEYEISRILAHRVTNMCEIEILIEWLGYPGEDTWEPLKKNLGCVWAHSYFKVGGAMELVQTMNRIVAESFWQKRVGRVCNK